MELKWLEDFISLANTGSFSRSAEERNVTQPAFSRRIKALEFWLGASLVDRSTYPTVLTPAGRAFRDVAESMLRQIYQLRDELRQAEHQARSTIRFAALHTLSLTFFPAWLRRISEGVGRLNTTMMADNMHDCMQALVTGTCDFLLTYAHPGVPLLLDPRRYPSVVLAEDKILPVCAPGPERKPLYSLPGTARAPLPYLAYSPDTFLGRIVEVAITGRQRGPHLSVIYENSMAEALKAMAVEGQGIAWLPASSIKRELKTGDLVPAGDESWNRSMEIRLYRTGDLGRPKMEEVWSLVCRQAEQKDSA
jgi:Transcriptional regulator